MSQIQGQVLLHVDRISTKLGVAGG